MHGRVWISSADAKAVAEAGFRLVHAPSDYFYLDCGAGGWVGNNPNGNSWCDPFKTWQQVSEGAMVEERATSKARLTRMINRHIRSIL
jgi:hexosaminidase